MKKTITINLNDYVKVKLTDVGKDIYYRLNEELNEAVKQRGGRPIENRMPAVDEDGYTSFQLHDLMTLYGPHIAMWKQLPFETNILYEVVENAPASDAEIVRHGRWVRQDETFTRFMCSACKARNYEGYEKYCPNCGAKMK